MFAIEIIFHSYESEPKLKLMKQCYYFYSFQYHQWKTSPSQGCHKETNSNLAVVVNTMEGMLITTTHYLMSNLPIMTVRASIAVVEVQEQVLV